MWTRIVYIFWGELKAVVEIHETMNVLVTMLQIPEIGFDLLKSRAKIMHKS
jgi:hypothetical protein